MKKFLLSLAAVVLGISASAETYTIDLSTVAPSDPSNFTAQGFSFTADNNKGTKPAYNADGKDLRLYANNLFTITAPAGVNITAIDFTLSKQGKTRQSTVAVNTGTMTQSAGVCTWAGAANAITYTVGDKADLGTDKTKAGQFCFTSLTITTSGAVTAKDPANLKFAQSEINVNLGEAVPANDLSRDTDAAPVFSSSDAAVATVNAATGAVTVVAAGTTTITATAAENDQYLAGTASYTLTVVDASNVIFEDACTDEATCKFQFLSLEEFNPWKIDGKYGLKANAFVSSTAKVSSAFAYVELDLTGRVAPIEMAFEHAVNQFKLNGTMIEPSQLKDYCHIQIATNGLNEEEDDDIIDLPVPEKFSWDFIPVKVDLSKYAGNKVTLGFHYESTAKIAGTWEIKNVKVTGLSGVNDVIAEDADAPVVYYNLQGVRVDNPANGLYIRVQGKKATKVLVR